ncbi:MAG: sensor histidine kinase [Sedimentibacter sp.]
MYKFKSGQVIPISTNDDFYASVPKKDNRKKSKEEIEKEINIGKDINIYDELFINASHELRTPLNIIYGAVQLAERYIDDDLNDESVEKIASSIKSIKRNNFRLIKLINNIMDMHKIEEGLLKPNYSYVNIIEVVENVVQSVSEKFNFKQLSITFDTDMEEKYMMADIEIIQRVLLNLMSNAVKFSKPEGKILVNVAINNNSVNIAVTDTGIGIDNKHLENIFNQYSQVDKSISRNAEGSGLGLRLSMGLIKAHEGSISVFSKINKGSTFIVKLPCKRNDNIYTLYNDKMINYDSLNEMINIEFSDIDRY